MKIKPYLTFDSEELQRLYQSVGWSAYTDDMATLLEGLRRSLLVLGAYEGEQLVGLVRAVGDGCTIVFVQDLLVEPAYQRSGVGSALLEAVLKRYPSVRQIELVTDNTPTNVAFYRAMGFKPLSEIGCCGFIKL